MCATVYDEIQEAASQGHTNVYLNYRKLSELPRELLELFTIQRLYLKRNVLKKLPADIWRLASLVELYLHSNSLHELPDGIGRLQFLEKLNVDNNHLKKLPATIGNLQSLVSLNVANNELVHLPKEIENLKNLRNLNVMNNKIESLPWQLCYCQSLKILSFDGNLIQKIPRQLMQHLGLVELSASGNKLRSIPHDVNKLVSLESLILDHNLELHLLPATLLKMESLSILGLSINSGEILQHHEEDFSALQQVLSLRYLPDRAASSVLPLIEVCFRAVYPFVKSFSYQRVSSLRLPNHVTELLTTPTGHCFVCDMPYFTAAFHLNESSDTALRIVKPNSTNLRRVRETRCFFCFCCCSKACLDKVLWMRDSPE